MNLEFFKNNLEILTFLLFDFLCMTYNKSIAGTVNSVFEKATFLANFLYGNNYFQKNL